uniref:G-protein coupled receptors family 1 profile domain-containing protein n=1 Tax=Panthera tigris altaica TaxID=74533 RepID=A0A8C9KCT5_PANTA
MAYHNTTQSHPSSFVLLGIPGLEIFYIWIGFPFCIVYLIALLGNVIILFIIQTEPSLHVLLPSNMFMTHLCTGLKSGILTVMAIDRYVATCNLLRYTMTLKNKVVTILGIVMIMRSLIFVIPFVFLILLLSFCGAHIITHTYCEHMGIDRLSCTSIRTNNLLGMVAFSMGLIDLIVIGFLYMKILYTVFCLPSWNALFKALNTCGSHICVIILEYIHIFLANLHMVVPPALNPVIYGVGKKQIQEKVLRILNPK